ncbi:hypothetical protein MUO66_07995 [Candidatus Bathyarchaeota archaeon]|nr:hypothetical protein [Candidatus Bathyarchaeota archaeon]
MTIHILNACKELIEDARKSCADLVFKEFSLNILSNAYNILNDTEFNQLVLFTSEFIADKNVLEFQPQLVVQN